MLKRSTLIIILLLPCQRMAAASSFLIPKENSSKKAATKHSSMEELGQSARNAVHSCNALGLALSEQQKSVALSAAEVAGKAAEEIVADMAAFSGAVAAIADSQKALILLQKKIIALLEALLEDHVVFRKSHKQFIQTSVSVMRDIEQQLAALAKPAQAESEKKDFKLCMDEAKMTAQAKVKQLHGMSEKFAADRCLKRV